MILEVRTVVARCDVCVVESAPYTTRRAGDPGVPDGWISEKRWNVSWSALVRRHYCSMRCCRREQHGLVVNREPEEERR